jgi:hypothetical protein
MLVADGVFHASGEFKVAPVPDGKQIAALFRNKVLKMLLAKGKITPERIAFMGNWRHRACPRRWVQPPHARSGASSRLRPTKAVFTPSRRSGRWPARAWT